jgi:sulfonate transport system substrate-binding protein
VGNQRGTTKALMLAAGVLDGAPYRVEWSEFPAAQSLLEALGSGAVDLGLVGDAPFQFAYQAGSPIVAVGAMAVVPPTPEGALAIIVPRGSTARSIRDLVGKRIASTRGSIGHYLVLRALQQADLPADAVHMVFLSPSDSQAALQTGAIDAWSTWTPYTVAALAQGARIAVDGRAFSNGAGFDVAYAGQPRPSGRCSPISWRGKPRPWPGPRAMPTTMPPCWRARPGSRWGSPAPPPCAMAACACRSTPG